MKCINCRCVIPDTSDYCVYCGHAVERGDEPTYPVRYAAYQTPVETPVFHSFAAVDDPNQYYGVLQENDGSDAYDTYYESDYVGYAAPVAGQSAAISEPAYYFGGYRLSTLLWCFAGLDFIIIILLLIILLLML